MRTGRALNRCICVGIHTSTITASNSDSCIRYNEIHAMEFIVNDQYSSFWAGRQVANTPPGLWTISVFNAMVV